MEEEDEEEGEEMTRLTRCHASLGLLVFFKTPSISFLVVLSMGLVCFGLDLGKNSTPTARIENRG